MTEILIIKIGALGDVLRTTPLLRALKGRITWVTQKSAFPLLAGNPRIGRLVDVEKIPRSLAAEKFDRVFCLDEDARACALASRLKKRDLVGTYLTEGRPAYTDSSRGWFDMGLLSRLGKSRADEIKKRNRKSYQEILFKMAGLSFRGEEYLLPSRFKKAGGKGRVGLEMRAGERWLAKRWPRFPEFKRRLAADGIPTLRFRQMPTLAGYIGEINRTEIVVTTDSLALHIALALGKKVAALFCCTSPDEIHGYGRMEKVVSPLLERYYYTTRRTMAPGRAIGVGTVRRALERLRG